MPGPAPLPPAAPFTEADFEANPEVAAVLRRCPVLDALVRTGLERRRLDHDQRVVLRHTLGHLPSAIPAVNYVLERCPEVPVDAFLRKPLRGSPISCPRIRQRIPDVTSLVGCHCAFPVSPDRYPTPLLHLDEARARGELDRPRQGRDEPGEAPAPLPEDVARTYAHLLERSRRVADELAAIRGAFVDALERLPDRTLPAADGAWALEQEEGLPAIVWKPAAGD